MDTNKAKRWAEGLDRDIGVANEKARMIDDGPKLGMAMKQDYKAKFEQWAACLQELKSDMASVIDQEQ